MVNKTKQSYIFFIFTLTATVLLWQVYVSLTNISDFLLPSPINVFEKYIELLHSGVLLHHTWVTTTEIVSGFLLGSAIGIVLGFIVAKTKSLGSILMPLLITIQTIPKLALAPLFLIWLGFGIWSKIVITALIVFFPIFINTLHALTSIDPHLRDLLTLIGASKKDVLSKLEIPSSLPLIFAGFKTGITLAVVGAVVGEFVGAKAGLGYLIIHGTGYLDTSMVFAAIAQLVLLGLLSYALIEALSRHFIYWHNSEEYQRSENPLGPK